MITELGLAILGTYAYNYLNTWEEQKIKYKFKKFIEEKELMNRYSTNKAKVKNVQLFDYGFRTTLDIGGICSFEDIEKHKNYLRSLFGAEEVNLKLTNDAKVNIEVINKTAKDINFEKHKLKNTELLIGHDSMGKPITADMKKCPHLLVTGLSGQGKTGLIKCIINNLNDADIVLCNAFSDDFIGYNKTPKLLGERNILNYLRPILERPYKRDRPLYILIEELATIKDKELNNTIKELLCIARHYNIFVIGIIQIATKEELKFKSYFNSRCSFKQLDESSYRVALGCSVDGELNNREFYFYSDNLYKGRTYSLTQ